MSPFPKSGDLLSKAYLEFVRGLPCFNCLKSAPSVAHHWPPRGRAGLTDDSRTIASCTSCHKRAHGETVNGKLPIPEDSQSEAVLGTRSLFMDRATIEQWEKFSEDRAKRMRNVIW